MSPLLIPWRLNTITSSSGAISIGVRGTKGLMPHVDAKTFICAWRKKAPILHRPISIIVKDAYILLGYITFMPGNHKENRNNHNHGRKNVYPHFKEIKELETAHFRLPWWEEEVRVFHPNCRDHGGSYRPVRKAVLLGGAIGHSRALHPEIPIIQVRGMSLRGGIFLIPKCSMYRISFTCPVTQK